MEPWLDSLSEDWKSEQRSSSPAPSLSSSRQHGSVSLSQSQSRIPHLANNIRKDSATGSFLKHRSTHGKARQISHSVLRERNASSLNLPAAVGSQKYSSLPRRTSSAFSESQNSVQHHSVREKSTLAETPEWKRRLATGEQINSDGFDLFAPSKLEGVFKQPNSSQLHSDKDSEITDVASNRNPFNLPTSNPFPEQYSSYRGTRSRMNLEVLEEVNEEEEPEPHTLSAVSSDLAKNGSLRGLVKQRVQSFERVEETRSGQSSPRELHQSRESSEYNAQDLRWRTISGQEELRNEFISPVTVSKQNSIRNTILRNPHDVDIQALQSRLKEAAPEDAERPSSSASDSYVDYANKQDTDTYFKDEPLPDLTSQSLPDDLSMGTQDFISHGGFINSRRGGRSNESSFLHKSLSWTQEHSQLEPNSGTNMQFRSSPPRHSHLAEDSIEQSKLSASAPATPQDTSIIHHTDTHLRPVSSGSPLKLFGNRDTYTNNKLMRILSHFEDPENSREKLEEVMSPEEAQELAFRMSQFGKGELDSFGFEQNVRRLSPIEAVSVQSEDRIFKTLRIESHRAADDVEQDKSFSNAREYDTQELPTTPVEKDRMTKRRKTLLQNQVPLPDREIEVKITELEEKTTLAGKKRKDARPGDEGMPAEPDVLASRDLLGPRSSRTSSATRIPAVKDVEALDVERATPNEDLTEALAAELATFAQEAVQVNTDSRKPSLATKDYMEEANKVMQFIRARGKPKPAATLPDISEPADVSEINPDSILDLDLDVESTKDDFSRPPSREGAALQMGNPRHVRHDSRTASYLRKYRDEEDTDALGGTSVFGTIATQNNKVFPEVAEATVPEELQESNPPNIRILNPSETMRKRKYSSSTIEGHPDPGQHQQSNSSTQHSFPTQSSTSGHKGVISSGIVSIPDQIGAMTFDYEKKIWVKKMSSVESSKPKSRQERQTFTEDDPFGEIPDLSIDEQQELAAKARLAKATASQTAVPSDVAIASTKVTSQTPPRTMAKVDVMVSEGRNQQHSDDEDTEEIDRSSLRSKASEHEAKLHNGIPSKSPTQLKDYRKQARVVTIAFSSPVISGVNYANLSEEDFSDLPREEDLPLDESEIHLDNYNDEQDLTHEFPEEPAAQSPRQENQMPLFSQEQVLSFQPRTISPIVEDDEEQFDPQMSLVRVKHSKVMTPAPPKSIAKLQKGGNKASSILCLTPLSDFSVHQVDRAKDPEQSYVDDRKHPNALRQAHGSLALAVDELVKAITDAAPDELFWDQLSRLNLASGSVSSVHSLKEYCPVLEQLDLSRNKISQLGGLPTSLRILDIHNNMVNDLTSWSRLQNLQYLDVSGNQLESLEGFSSLIHLRSLKANNNHISNIEGILDLDSLLDLELSDNDLIDVDFEGSELSRLKRLDLSHNQLEYVKNLNCLPALAELDLSHNGLQSFATACGESDIPLVKLRLSHNSLQVLGLKHMPVLRHLDLDHNNIKDIQGLCSAYHLEFLSLRAQGEHCDIVEMVLSTPNECRHVRLSSNSVINGTFKLPTLPQNNLRELEIAACGISEIPERFGLYFPNCRYLNANFNAIKEVAPLRKMGLLKTLLLARNRIQKLRRTCLVMSRLPSLKQIDLRDNPLTLGFYNPVPAKVGDSEPVHEARYQLPDGSEAEDAMWMKVLDETAGLKRRTIELLLAEHCKELIHLDGLRLHHEQLRAQDTTWNKLTGKGVLVKAATSTWNDRAGTDGHRHDTGPLFEHERDKNNDGDVFQG